MGLGPIVYSQDRTVFDLQSVSGGDAAEIEARAAALLAGAASPSEVAEMVLCGTGNGPGWRLVFGLGAGASASIARTVARIVAAVGLSPDEARDRLVARLTELGIETVHKIELKGGGEGTSVLAVALAE